VAVHFGKAATYTIVDMTTDDVQVIRNDGTHMGGHRLPPEILAEHDVNVMLVGGLGPRAVQMFASFGIEVFVGADGTVRDALTSWKADLLSLANSDNACQEHRH